MKEQENAIVVHGELEDLRWWPSKNTQPEGVSPIQQANGLQHLITEFGITHDKAAEMVGRSRSAVTNLLRLLGLAAPVRELMQQGNLDMGHARALLALS